MEKKITQETDGFSNESLSLLMVANWNRKNLALNERKHFARDEGIEWLERCEFAIKCLISF
jgi:hypothetical protein